MDIESVLRDKERMIRAEGCTPTVDFLIRTRGKYFLQKRSASRKLFPNTWEITGGHVENDEDIIECIRRELYEETVLKLARIIEILHEFDWEGVHKKGITVLVEAEGDIIIEKGDKISEYRLLDEKELEKFLEEEQLDEPIRIPLDRVLVKS